MTGDNQRSNKEGAKANSGGAGKDSTAHMVGSVHRKIIAWTANKAGIHGRLVSHMEFESLVESKASIWKMFSVLRRFIISTVKHGGGRIIIMPIWASWRPL